MAKKATGNDANLGFEAQLWAAADKLRGNMEPSDYKHVALGLIFLKYISDAFEAKRAELLNEELADAEDPEEYLAENVFWVPKEARWSHLRARAKLPTIGKDIDDAMLAIEARNASLKGVLPKDYARPALNKVMLGELIDLVSGIGMAEEADRSRDILGRVYEYFLGGFAGAEGKRGGEFYTPRSVVRLLVEMRGTVQGPRLRPMLRLRRHVRAVGEVRRGARRAHRRHRDLRSGEQLHDLAPRQDEPGGAWHRRRYPLEQRGQLPQGRTAGSEGRLHPRQSAVQRLRLGRRPAEGGRPLDVRRSPRGQRQLRLAPAHPSSPRPEWDGGRGARQWLHVHGHVRRRRHPPRLGGGRRGGLHDRATWTALLLDTDSRLPLVPDAQQASRFGNAATGAASCCS